MGKVWSGRVSFDQFNQSTPDDDAISESGDLADLIGRTDAEADGERKLGQAACAGNEGLDRVGDGLLFAGDAGARDEIDETGGVFGDQPEAAFAAGGGG